MGCPARTARVSLVRSFRLSRRAVSLCFTSCSLPPLAPTHHHHAGPVRQDRHGRQPEGAGPQVRAGAAALSTEASLGNQRAEPSVLSGPHGPLQAPATLPLCHARAAQSEGCGSPGALIAAANALTSVAAPFRALQRPQEREHRGGGQQRQEDRHHQAGPQLH